MSRSESAARLDDEGGEEFSFARFANQPFYQATNERLVELANLAGCGRVLDLACGTGTVTRLILEAFDDLRDRCVIAMDASAQALQEAQEELADAGSSVVRFVESRAEELSEPVEESVDAVVFCNAIHMVRQKDKVVEQVRRVLAPEGLFAFNTSFFEGSHPEESEAFYRRWMMQAMRILRREHDIRVDREEKVASRLQLSVGEYEELLGRHDLSVRDRRVESVGVPLEGWLGISEYREFIRGALPGVPLEEGREALQEAARTVFDKLELEDVPRNWLHVVARR